MPPKPCFVYTNTGMKDINEQHDLFVPGLTKVEVKRVKKVKKKKKRVVFKQSDLFSPKDTSIRVDMSPNP